MNEINTPSHLGSEVLPEGPPPAPPPGPIMQSVVIGFKAVYIVVLLLGAAWLFSNIRQIDSDSQAVVMRFGRIVHTQKSGLLLAWPRPIEEVQLLPGPDRQLSQAVEALPAVEGILSEATGTAASTSTIPASASPYITGDNNIVLLDASLIYHITDPERYFLAKSHITSALNRLFHATAVRITAEWSLNDFLVAQPSAAGGSSGQTITALRDAVRQNLLDTMNQKLQTLTQEGVGLGITIDRIDMTAWLPPQAKIAFDAVLTATQTANQNIAAARTAAENRRQGAAREGDRVVSAAQATAKERIVGATVDTSRISAIKEASTAETRSSLMNRAYRDDIGKIFAKAGTVTVVDSKGSAHYILPGNQQ
jgi:regulator of protease activity HflC (stomatin/prohibitin superfamily)